MKVSYVKGGILNGYFAIFYLYSGNNSAIGIYTAQNVYWNTPLSYQNSDRPLPHSLRVFLNAPIVGYFFLPAANYACFLHVS